jgi:hypothetical protein
VCSTTLKSLNYGKASAVLALHHAVSPGLCLGYFLGCSQAHAQIYLGKLCLHAPALLGYFLRWNVSRKLMLIDGALQIGSHLK